MIDRLDAIGDNAGMKTLRLATRQSPLALWQTEHVAARLRVAHPGLQVELVAMTTRGDRIIDRPLSEIGGKGLFLKELEVAMLEGTADAAVHSLKDVPMTLDGPFVLAAMLERADPFDAFVSHKYTNIDALPAGARVGTSSLRRQAQLRARRKDLVVSDLRGNVNTRLAKMEAGEYDAIILACAGLERLGLSRHIRHRLEAPGWLPAVAQGAITIECRDGDADTAEPARRARPRADPHLRGGRAGDEPAPAWQLHGTRSPATPRSMAASSRSKAWSVPPAPANAFAPAKSATPTIRRAWVGWSPRN